jgi:LPXTG-motif cell wall-anchored protein
MVDVERVPGPDPTSAVRYTVTFSEPVIGFTASDISFAGSTVPGNLVATITPMSTSVRGDVVLAADGPPQVFGVAVTGMTGPGRVEVSLAAGAVTDAAGNPSLASTSLNNAVDFDPAAAAATTSSPPGTLPVTGTDNWSSTVLAVLGVLGGVLLVLVARRRPTA